MHFNHIISTINIDTKPLFCFVIEITVYIITKFVNRLYIYFCTHLSSPLENATDLIGALAKHI